jgi:hypothetical protein
LILCGGDPQAGEVFTRQGSDPSPCEEEEKRQAVVERLSLSNKHVQADRKLLLLLDSAAPCWPHSNNNEWNNKNKNTFEAASTLYS